MSDRPLCNCHGEPMYFTRDARYRIGGFWRCGVKIRAKTEAWREKHPDKRWEYHKRERLLALEQQRARVVAQLEHLEGT